MDTSDTVSNAVDQLSLIGNFLVTNADNWFGTSITAVAQANELAKAVGCGSVKFDK